MNKPVEYEQTDARWRNVSYSITGSASQTIGTSGCGPTCAAMVAATLKGGSHTPVTACAWAKSHGYRTKNDGTAWAFFPAYFKTLGISCTETASTEAAVNALRAGKMVVTCATRGIWTSSGHFILAYGLDSAGRVMIHDPNSEAAYRELAALSTYRAQTVHYWVIDDISWRDNMEKKTITIYNEDTGKTVQVEAVADYDAAGNATNYVKLRDVEKVAPIAVGYDAGRKLPTVRSKAAGGGYEGSMDNIRELVDVMASAVSTLQLLLNGKEV